MLFPAAVIFYEDKLEVYKCCCCCKKTKDVQTVDNMTDRSDADLDKDIKQESKIDIFFAGTWNTNVYKFRWVIIVIFVAWAAIMSY